MTKSMPNETRFLLEILLSKDLECEHLTSHEFDKIQWIQPMINRRWTTSLCNSGNTSDALQHAAEESNACNAIASFIAA